MHKRVRIQMTKGYLSELMQSQTTFSYRPPEVCDLYLNRPILYSVDIWVFCSADHRVLEYCFIAYYMEDYICLLIASWLS